MLGGRSSPRGCTRGYRGRLPETAKSFHLSKRARANPANPSMLQAGGAPTGYHRIPRAATGYHRIPTRAYGIPRVTIGYLPINLSPPFVLSEIFYLQILYHKRHGLSRGFGCLLSAYGYFFFAKLVPGTKSWS